VRSFAFVLAIVIVVAVPIAAVGAASSGAQWARWVYGVGGIVGIAGLVLTTGLLVNLVVPRTCSTTTVDGEPSHEINRPAISLVLGGGECFRSALLQGQAAALAGVATSAVVALVDVTGRRRPLRRSGRAGAGASPGVRFP
jgi:hypothetical protein